MNELCCVISAYGAAGVARALTLAAQTADLFRKTVVVINEDDRASEAHRQVGFYHEIRRPNLGMNIGAWLCGIKKCDAGYPVVCLQDECEMVSNEAPQRYMSLLSQSGVGMVGESLNPKWAHDWHTMRCSPLNYRITLLNGQEISRVDYYLQCMRLWGIKTGPTAAHLRTLTCGFSWDVAQSLPNLALSTNKEECIAAEIAISQYVMHNLGLQMVQSAATPFRFFSHPEWEPGGLQKKSLPRFSASHS